MATRFYLPASTASTPISPNPDAGWEDTTILGRANTRTAKIADAMATVSFADNNATDRDIIFRQFVSQELEAGQTITGSQAIKAQIRAQERDASCNMFVAIGIRVIAANGSTVQKTVLAITRDATEISAASLQNRQFTATSAATNYTTVAGDRLVIEIGTAGDPGGGSDHDSDLRFGDAAAGDLAENDTATTDDNPWVELTDTLSFLYSATAAVSVGSATLSASATFSPGTKTATAALSITNATLSASATFTAPVYTASSALTVSNATLAAAATHTAPTYTASAALTVGSATLSASATFVGPEGPDDPIITLTQLHPGVIVGQRYGDFNHTGGNVFTATAALTSSNATLSASATFSPGTKTATAALTSSSATLSSSATFTAPVYTATASLTASNATLTSSATFTAPVYTATASLTASNVTLAATAIFATAVYSASAALTVSTVTASSTATFTAGTKTAAAALTSSNAVFAAAATFTAPVYTASAALTSTKATFTATATFTAPVYTSSAALTVADTTFAATATFTAPVYTATASLTVAAAIASATATHTSPTYTASVTVTVAATTFVASATFVPGEAAVIGAMRRLTARVFVRPRIGGRDINVGESAVMRKRRINAGLEGS